MAETKSVAGTQTEKNLATSYLNESQSYARYTFYAQNGKSRPQTRYNDGRATASG